MPPVTSASVGAEAEFVQTAWSSGSFADVFVAITVRNCATLRGPADGVPVTNMECDTPRPGGEGHSQDAPPLPAQQRPRDEHQAEQQQQQRPAVVRVPCIRFELAKASLTFRAQLQRWAGGGGVSSSGATLEVAVEADEVQAMQALLEFIHTRQLPPGLPAEELCRLLRLAHFYAVQPAGDGGGGAGRWHWLPQPACLKRPKDILTPLETLFSDEELGAPFDELPLVAVGCVTKPCNKQWASKETVFMASLRWLEANAASLDDGGAAEAADRLFGQLEFSQMELSLLLAAAQRSAAFKAWPGSLAAVAAAGYVRTVDGSQLGGASWCSQLAQSVPGMHAEVPFKPSPQRIKLSVPMGWLEHEAGRLQGVAAAVQQQRQQRAARQATPAERQKEQERLCSVFEGPPVVYRGFKWSPSLELSMALPAGHAWALGQAQPQPPPQLQLPQQGQPQQQAQAQPQQGQPLEQQEQPPPQQGQPAPPPYRAVLVGPVAPVHPTLNACLCLKAKAPPPLLAVGDSTGSVGGGGSSSKAGGSSGSNGRSGSSNATPSASASGGSGCDTALHGSLGPLVRAQYASLMRNVNGAILWAAESDSHRGALLAGAFGSDSGTGGRPASLASIVSCPLDAFQVRDACLPAASTPSLSCRLHRGPHCC
ncbi:hypothetical protein ABPG75_012339 [Micractinium tetrahymenae]